MSTHRTRKRNLACGAMWLVVCASMGCQNPSRVLAPAAELRDATTQAVATLEAMTGCDLFEIDPDGQGVPLRVDAAAMAADLDGYTYCDEIKRREGCWIALRHSTASSALIAHELAHYLGLGANHGGRKGEGLLSGHPASWEHPEPDWWRAYCLAERSERVSTPAN